MKVTRSEKRRFKSIIKTLENFTNQKFVDNFTRKVINNFHMTRSGDLYTVTLLHDREELHTSHGDLESCAVELLNGRSILEGGKLWKYSCQDNTYRCYDYNHRNTDGSWVHHELKFKRKCKNVRRQMRKHFRKNGYDKIYVFHIRKD